MKKLNENPTAWFIVTIIIGFLLVQSDNFELFIIFFAGVVLSKLVEILINIKK